MPTNQLGDTMKDPISKTTVKFAKARGIAVYSFEIEAQTLVSIAPYNNEDGGEVNYSANLDGSFTFVSNTWLGVGAPDNILDEKHLLSVIDFIAGQIGDRVVRLDQVDPRVALAVRLQKMIDQSNNTGDTV
tara:strand:- start:1428 stop:1820 length:393 start_codon:yes stop_codon:yes gene_type:complete